MNNFSFVTNVAVMNVISVPCQELDGYVCVFLHCQNLLSKKINGQAVYNYFAVVCQGLLISLGSRLRLS